MQDPLEELQKKIYQKGLEIGQRPKGDLSFLRAPRPDVGWQGRRGKSFFARNIWFLFLAGFIVLAGIVFIYLGISSFSEEKLSFTIQGQSQITGADIVSWRVIITNNNRVDLEETKLIFFYPDGAIPIDDNFVSGLRSEVPLARIEHGQTLERVFRARLLGREDEVKNIKASFSYHLEGISPVLQRDAYFQTKILTAPLVLDIQAPKELSQGGEILWHIVYKNTSDFDFANLRFRAQYPEEFTFLSASPPPGKSLNEWGPFSFKAGQEHSIEIRGTIQGAQGQQKTIEGFLELLEEGREPLILTSKVATTLITLTPLDIKILVNGKEGERIAHKGEVLSYAILYQNNLSFPIDDVFVEAQVVGEMADVEGIQSDGMPGATKGEIRWDKSTTPHFAHLLSQESGMLSLQLPLKDTFPIKNFSHKNFTIQLLVKMGSSSPPPSHLFEEVTKEVDLVIPIGTEVTFKTEGAIWGSPFQNTGPIPPAVNQKTTYTVFWRITSASNDLEEVHIKTVLPSWSSFSGVKKINFGEVGFSYDQATKTIFWNIDRLPATTGIALPTYEAAFQVELIPLSDQIGKVLDIVGQSQFYAKDAFTKEEINIEVQAVKTDLGGKIPFGNARVSQ